MTTLINGSQTHFSVGVDIASSGASNAYRAALVLERTDRYGTRVELAIAARGLRPTDLTEKVVALLRQVDSSVESPRRTWITVAIDRTGDAGTAEMLESAIRDEKWRCVIKIRRVWIAAGDNETPPAKDDSTDRFHTKWTAGRDLLLHGLAKRLRLGEVDPSNASGDAASILREELSGIGIQQTASGKQRLDHAKGKHDDVVMALALADWAARSRRQGGYTTTRPPGGAMRQRPAGAAAGDVRKPKKKSAGLASPDSLSRPLAHGSRWGRG